MASPPTVCKPSSSTVSEKLLPVTTGHHSERKANDNNLCCFSKPSAARLAKQDAKRCYRYCTQHLSGLHHLSYRPLGHLCLALHRREVQCKKLLMYTSFHPKGCRTRTAAATSTFSVTACRAGKCCMCASSSQNPYLGGATPPHGKYCLSAQ